CFPKSCTFKNRSSCLVGCSPATLSIVETRLQLPRTLGDFTIHGLIFLQFLRFAQKHGCLATPAGEEEPHHERRLTSRATARRTRQLARHAGRNLRQLSGAAVRGPHRWREMCLLRADLDALFPPGGEPTLGPSEETALPQVPGYEVEAILGRGGMVVV